MSLDFSATQITLKTASYLFYSPFKPQMIIREPLSLLYPSPINSFLGLRNQQGHWAPSGPLSKSVTEAVAAQD